MAYVIVSEGRLWFLQTVLPMSNLRLLLSRFDLGR